MATEEPCLVNESGNTVGSATGSGQVGESLRRLLAQRLGREMTPPQYSLTVERVRSMLRSRSAELAAERENAPVLLKDLLGCPQGRRLMLVRNSARYHVLALGYVLVERCADVRFAKAKEAVELAVLAVEVASQLDMDHYGRGMVEDLKALAWAHLADCHRRCGDMGAAKHAMNTAESRFRWGTGDGLLEARLLGIKVSICRRLGRFSAGLQLMDRVLVLSHREGNPQMVGQALVKKARLLGDMGDSRSALWLLQQASQQIDGEADPRLQLFLRHNLICCLIDLGEVGQARRLLRASRSTYHRFQEGYVQMNLRWVEGLVAAGLGDWEEAQVALEESRQGMESLGQPHTAAQVAVDLAEVLEHLERPDEALRLAQQSLPQLSERSLMREKATAEALIQRLENYPATGSGMGC